MEDHLIKNSLEALFEKIVSVSISMQESVIRIDERVRQLFEHQLEVEKTIKEIVTDQRDLNKRFVILETKNLDKIIEEINNLKELNQIKLAKLTSLEGKIDHIESINTSLFKRGMGVVDLVAKTLVACLVGYLLYKLGINPALLGH
jgi:hypothetical protein